MYVNCANTTRRVCGYNLLLQEQKGAKGAAGTVGLGLGVEVPWQLVVGSPKQMGIFTKIEEV